MGHAACAFVLDLHDGDLDLQVAEGPGGAGVEPAHLLVHAAAAIAHGRDEDLTGEQMAAAEAALAVAAVGVDLDAGALQSHSHGLGGVGLDHILLDAADHGDLEGLGLGALGVAGAGGDVGGVIDHVVAEAARGHAHNWHLLGKVKNSGNGGKDSYTTM